MRIGEEEKKGRMSERGVRSVKERGAKDRGVWGTIYTITMRPSYQRAHPH